MPILTTRLTTHLTNRFIGRLGAAAILTLLTASALLTAGCHDDTPPDDGVSSPPPAVSVSPPPVPAAPAAAVPVKAIQKTAKPTVPVKRYLQTDAAGIVIVHPTAGH